MKTLAIATASLGLVFAASPAVAQSNALPTAEVSFAGLNLETPEGQRILDQRIERAARSVCNYYHGNTGTRIRQEEVYNCLSKARASARQQMANIVEDQRRGG